MKVTKLATFGDNCDKSMAGLQPFGMRRVAALALVVVSCNLDGASAFSGSVLGAPGHSLRRSTGAAFSAKPGLSLRPSARRAVLKNLNAVLDPASVHHAADLMQHDWSVAVQYFADASAAALDVVDPSKLSSGVEGTGLTKPFELPFADQIPDIPFPKVISPPPPSGLARTTCSATRIFFWEGFGSIFESWVLAVKPSEVSRTSPLGELDGAAQGDALQAPRHHRIVRFPPAQPPPQACRRVGKSSLFLNRSQIRRFEVSRLFFMYRSQIPVRQENHTRDLRMERDAMHCLMVPARMRRSVDHHDCGHH